MRGRPHGYGRDYDRARRDDPARRHAGVNANVLADEQFKGRADLIDFAKTHDIPIATGKENDAPYSVDANLLHSSSEGKVLEDPGVASVALPSGSRKLRP